MKKKLFLLSVLCLLMLNCFAQSNVKGKVVADDSLKSPIPFSAVVLGDVADSSKFLYSTITDMSGMYHFSGVEDGDYVLMSQCLGYDKYSERIEISGKDFVKNITMASSINELGEVEVLGRTIEKSFNKTAFTITASDRQKASNSVDMLRTIPQLKIDHLNNGVSTKDGGSVMILLNGFSASESELLAISKNDISRVEFIDFPSGRYSDYSAVINVVTKEKTSGGTAGFDCTNALNSGLADESVFFSLNKGTSKFSFQYDLSHRNYDDGYVDSYYNYELLGDKYDVSTKSKNFLKYTTHDFDVSYTNLKLENYAFQVKFQPSVSKRSSLTDGVKNIIKNTDVSKGTETFARKSDEFNPVANVYFSKNLPNGQELLLDVVYTGYFSSNDRVMTDVFGDKDTTLYDYTNADNDKYSVISELAYNKVFGTQKLGVGYKYQFANDDYKVLNASANPSYNTRNYVNKFYVDYGAKFNKFSYFLKCQYVMARFVEDFGDEEYSQDAFTPNLKLQYDLSEISAIKLIGKSSLEEPSLVYLSNDRVSVTNEIFKGGNSELKPYWTCGAELLYEYNGDVLELTVGAEYKHSPKGVTSDYKKIDNLIFLTYANTDYIRQASAKLNMGLNPFESEWFYWDLSAKAINYKARFNDGSFHKLTSFPLYSSFEFFVGDCWDFCYEFKLPVDMPGNYISTSENLSGFSITYDADNFSVGLLWYWPFSHSKYGSKTFDNNVLDYHSKNGYYDNRNMIVLNFSYNFQFGRKYKDVEKKLKNQDNDSGVMIK